MRRLTFAALALALVAALPAAAAAPRAGKARLKAFGSCEELIRYGKARIQRGPGAGAPQLQAPEPLFERRGPGIRLDAPLQAAPMAEGDAGSSRTNVQEAGVDEPDLVKSAGSRMFAVGAGALHAIDADGPRVVGSLALAGNGHELLLHGDRLLVIAHDDAAGAQPAHGPRWDPGVTVLTEVDVSRPGAMRVVRTERIRGVHVSSRLTGRTARVVMWSPPQASYRPAVRGELRGWLPRRAVRKRGRGLPTYRRAAACRQVRRPATFSGTDVLTVLTIDLERGLPAVDSDAILSGGQVVYASGRSLYVATQKWTPQVDRAVAPPDTLTTIHRFDTSDPDATAYRASGEVRGALLNQFALSEHDGMLRAASTDGIGPDESESFVTVLDERDGRLTQIGQVGGLGPRERIYAVRFIGDAAYVVTFRQVDPLYVVDLSTPAQPRLRGELKLRGYSAYLHPIDDGLLLGVGQDATERGVTQGLQVSLFDVSDPSTPRRLHSEAVQSGESTAELNHHAFLWWAPQDLAVMPLSIYDDEFFDGAVGFRVQRSPGIAELGRVAHPDGWVIQRALVVGGRLFTVSAGGIAANEMDTLAARVWVPFPQQ